MKRVVVTGMSGISPIGSSWDEIRSNLENGRTGIKYIEEWDRYEDLNTRLAGPVTDFIKPDHFGRKVTRSMGRGALMATVATERALQQAGLLDSDELRDGRCGVSYGSCMGASEATREFGNMLLHGNTGGLNANSYLKLMTHTATVNIGVYFGLKGRVYPTTSACTSGSQGIGYAFEAIKYGKQQLMVGGGSEELCATQAAVFDTLYATSIVNDTPHLSPRPFDSARDGLVIGEGAGTFILEELEHAQARGATIYAEVVGYGTNSDGKHVTTPAAETMQRAMELALEDANLKPEDIGYISAHGTSTEKGDIAETTATEKLFGSNTPISAFKSFTGHTLGACGALEAWTTIEMMNANWFHGSANLDSIDPLCGELDYLTGAGREIKTDYVMSNNFAFGGINTSLIFKRWKK